MKVVEVVTIITPAAEVAVAEAAVAIEITTIRPSMDREKRNCANFT